MRSGPFALTVALWVSCAIAQDGSAGGLLAVVRAAVKAGGDDAAVAATVHNTKLTERLDDAVIEELQSEGAGPKTLEELDRQRELTRKLAATAERPQLFDAPPEPTAEERARLLDKAREIAMQYTASLPDFLCTETVRRYVDPKVAEAWKATDTLKMDVAFSEKGERYRLLEINGRRTTKTLREVGGFSSNGEFGSLLKWIFAPASATQFQWEHWTNLHGRPTYVFSYRIDPAHSHYSMNWKKSGKTYSGIAGMRGVVYLDRETNQPMRFSDEADGIPADWPILRTPAVVDYDYADVGGRDFCAAAGGFAGGAEGRAEPQRGRVWELSQVCGRGYGYI